MSGPCHADAEASVDEPVAAATQVIPGALGPHQALTLQRMAGNRAARSALGTEVGGHQAFRRASRTTPALRRSVARAQRSVAAAVDARATAGAGHVWLARECDPSIMSCPDADAPTAREEAEQQSLPSEHPQSTKPRDLNPQLAAEYGRDALATVGYDELIRHALGVGFLRRTGESGSAAPAGVNRSPKPQRPAARSLQREAVTFGVVFTRYAIAAGIASQVDSPAPGPGDVVALGILAVGLVAAGIAVMSRPACPPCPANPAPEIDRVPPSTPHWPCPGDHWHYQVYNQNPTTCQCFLSSRLFGGCCGLPGAPC